MKKKIIVYLAVSVLIMLVLPWLAVTFVKSDAGMAICFLLFFVVNPIYSLMVGVFAGRDIKHFWGLPAISVALFLAGTWIFFDVKEAAFILYALVYFALGIAAMLIFRLVRK